MIFPAAYDSVNIFPIPLLCIYCERKKCPDSAQYFWQGTNFTKKLICFSSTKPLHWCRGLSAELLFFFLSLCSTRLSILWHYLNNPCPGPRIVGLLVLQRMLVKIRYLKAPFDCRRRACPMDLWQYLGVCLKKRRKWVENWAFWFRSGLKISSNFVDSYR